MKRFEIQTPALQEASDAFRNVIAGRQDGGMERDEARDIVAAGNGVVRAVGQELKVRLAMPRIAAAEAKMIDHEQPERQGRIDQQDT